MRGGFLERVGTPTGAAFLALALLLGGGLSLVILDDDTGLTRLTSALSKEDLGVAQALVQVTPEPDRGETSSVRRVRPVVECVDRSGGTWIAHFGYQNINDFAVDVGSGDDNHLDPASLDGPQPTSFDAGAWRFDFAVRLDAGATAAWNLEGRTATAGPSSPECDFGAYDDVTVPDPA